MDNGAQAAETITRVVIMGSTFILGLGGKVALSVARFAAAAMDPNAKQSGKVRLKALLQSGSELKVFTLQGEANYQRFAAEAKNYGILYSVVKRTDEDVQGEVYDLLVKAEDAGKINRVIEKFHLIEVEGNVVHVDPQSVEESRVVDARTLLSKMLSQQDNSANPTQASEESSLSDASLRTPNQANRPSVVKELNGYIEEAEKQYTGQKTAQNEVQATAGIMPNVMGDELAEEEKRRQGEAAVLLGNMLSGEKESEESVGDVVAEVKESVKLPELLPSKDKGLEA